MKKFVYLFVAIVMIASLIGFTTKAEASGYRWEVDVTMAPWTPDHVDNIVGDGALFGNLVKGNSATWDFWVTYKQWVTFDYYTCDSGWTLIGDHCQKVTPGYWDEKDANWHETDYKYVCPDGYVENSGHSGNEACKKVVAGYYEYHAKVSGHCPDGFESNPGGNGDKACRKWHQGTTEYAAKIKVIDHEGYWYCPSGYELSDHEDDHDKPECKKWVPPHTDTHDAEKHHGGEWIYTQAEFSGGLPPKVYIPNFDLFLSKEGFGVVGPNSSGLMETVQYCTLLSSTSTAVSVEIIADRCLVGDKKGLGVSALPADLTNPTCSAPVLAPVDLSPGIGLAGTWACDSMLKNIPTAVDGITVNGSRFPLFSSDPDSAAQKATLWYVLTHSPWLTP
jgi:hypothetical protein